MKDTVKVATANALFWVGYYWYKAFKVTPHYSYLSLRKLFYSTNTQFNQRVSEKIAKENPVYADLSKGSGVLGDLSASQIKSIAESLQREGFYIFDQQLDQATIDALLAFSFHTKAKLVPVPAGEEPYAFFDRANPKAIKYQFFEKDLVQDATVQKLISDESILAVAQSFLKAKPVLDLISMWWSTAISKKASSEVAQLYHWDMERIKFVKFFFYLTDVDTNTGPHCYIKGSNNGFPAEVRRDGRITDEEIKGAYSSEKIIEIVGKKGTIMAVDTSGFHKGKNLAHGDRLLLQFEFSNSLFGVKNDYFQVNTPVETFKAALRKFPFVFQRFSL
jgi:hypothetical protein